ncbi:MAG: class A beta-lactamase-related serine hydrolase [Muribaculaceae bacterium]|nr:class A beta-lactamase-related serine hydrolase [Muribaculaceae bacterium]
MKYNNIITTLFLAIILMTSVGSCNSKGSEPEVQFPNDSTINARLDTLLKDVQAEVGVAIALEDTIITGVNIDSIFPMMSVFKLHIAMALVDKKVNVDSMIHITPDKLKYDVYSPIYEEHPRGNIDMSISELMHWSLNYSDNNASDMLIEILGGPEVANDYLKQFKLDNTQIIWKGYDMHLVLQRYFDNYTTPRDAIKILKEAHKRKWLADCLAECKSGVRRIPALLPGAGKKQVKVGHKTGTGGTIDGMRCGYNDVAFVDMPDGRHYYIAIFINRTKMQEDEIATIIAQISKIAYDEINAHYHPKVEQEKD